MTKIRLTVKNQFFTYFEMNGMPGKYRILKQVWNAQGIEMMIQGPSWDGAGINGFGKRHLLSTEGGKQAGRPEDKATGVLRKRQGPQAADRRAVRMRQMADALAGPPPANMKDKSTRDAYLAKKTTVKDKVEKGYAPSVYGPNTPICTFVILDGLHLDEVANCFATPIVAANMADGDSKDIVVRFDDPRVIDVKLNGDIEHYYAISVTVKRAGRYHHIHHCNGALSPELAVAFDWLFG
jgi:hypothetical protein